MEADPGRIRWYDLLQFLYQVCMLIVVGILTALFYGSLAERRGEKVVLLLSTIGYITMQLIDVGICEQNPTRCCEVNLKREAANNMKGSIPLILPIQMVWSSSLFLLVGGGQRVFNSMVFTLLSGQLDDNVRCASFLCWVKSC